MPDDETEGHSCDRRGRYTPPKQLNMPRKKQAGGVFPNQRAIRQPEAAPNLFS